MPRWSALERELRASRGPLLAGIDEVGRGPLAGPVVACAVVMPPDMRAIRGVDDSKKLTGAERERMATRIRERALSVAVGAASVREIDRINIYHAAVLAMRRALGRLRVTPNHVLVDGNPIRTLGVEHKRQPASRLVLDGVTIRDGTSKSGARYRGFTKTFGAARVSEFRFLFHHTRRFGSWRKNAKAPLRCGETR